MKFIIIIMLILYQRVGPVHLPLVRLQRVGPVLDGFAGVLDGLLGVLLPGGLVAVVDVAGGECQADLHQTPVQLYILRVVLQLLTQRVVQVAFVLLQISHIDVPLLEEVLSGGHLLANQWQCKQNKLNHKLPNNFLDFGRVWAISFTLSLRYCFKFDLLKRRITLLWIKKDFGKSGT